MLNFALKHDGPISMRYPKANLDKVERLGSALPIELGKSEVISWGEDGCFVAFGALLSNCAMSIRSRPVPRAESSNRFANAHHEAIASAGTIASDLAPARLTDRRIPLFISEAYSWVDRIVNGATIRFSSKAPRG
jgi:hypothetical protein